MIAGVLGFWILALYTQMSAVGITENVKGDVKKFEIWYSGREEVYVIQVKMFKLIITQKWKLYLFTLTDSTVYSTSY